MGQCSVCAATLPMECREKAVIIRILPAIKLFCVATTSILYGKPLPYLHSRSNHYFYFRSYHILGEVEGRLGVIRLFGILPRYHGLCIGSRLLKRVEKAMAIEGCVRCMACIPSARGTMCDWIERRGKTFMLSAFNRL